MSECPVPIITWVPVSQVSIKNNLHAYYKAVVCDSHNMDSESLGHICSHLSHIKRLNLYNSVYREQQRNWKNLQLFSQRSHMGNSHSRTGFSPLMCSYLVSQSLSSPPRSLVVFPIDYVSSNFKVLLEHTTNKQAEVRDWGGFPGRSSASEQEEVVGFQNWKPYN